ELLLFHVFVLERNNQTFETKTVSVGENVKLTCPRQRSITRTNLYWIRLESGKMPEFLGGTYSFNYTDGNETPHITAKQEPGTFVLKISETELSDTGLYYCMKVEMDRLDMRFLKGIFLRVKGSEPDVTAVIQDPISDPVRPGDSVTLQCSVLSDTESKSCPTDHSVYWFRAGSDESHPSLIYFHGNSNYQCEKSPEPLSSQSCVYRFSKTVSSSDAGTYYCAVATCGRILFGNGTKLDTESLSMWDVQTTSTVLLLLCTILAISLIIIAFLIYAIKKKTCDSRNGNRVLSSINFPTITALCKLISLYLKCAIFTIQLHLLSKHMLQHLVVIRKVSR
uniref:Ig-like domain-containing protein n=1 Tax=Anabas testudineus TaxID=64144 RepID=A0A3Q1H743_ANATE